MFASKNFQSCKIEELEWSFKKVKEKIPKSWLNTYLAGDFDVILPSFMPKIHFLFYYVPTFLNF